MAEKAVTTGGKLERRGWRIGLAAMCLALIALLAAAAAGFCSRFGLWHFRTGFAILKWAAWGGLASALLSLAGVYLSARQRFLRGVILSLAAMATGIVVFAVPLKWKLTAQQVPPIHDISTDTDKPPQFVAILPLRKDAPNSAVYEGTVVALKQRSAYPDIRTVIVPLPAAETFARAEEAARSMGWQIVAAEAGEGRIEATDTTFWFGFTDDIVIRITPADYRSLVDIRSVSRVGRSDAGTNAKRIRAYIAKLGGRG
jgi:uncharacterized protein (DUF1499 family)